ncbi:hypothetical protein Bbelb_327920 [Branchiostoma belcheri]|nr:hypothetical protein Bbelb_327920 [Branchiostoma belcheri]
MLRVCEKLREADEKGRRYGLARAETGYLRALVDAMADTDRLAEVELLKTLGDVNVGKGRLGKDVGKFNTALALYLAAMVRCYHEEQGDGIEHRYHYTERLLQGVLSQGREQPTEDKDTTTPAKVAAKCQDLDKRRATGGNTDSLLVGYAQVMVEAIVKDNSMLETEAIKKEQKLTDETKSRPPVSLIQTPAKLAEYQHLHIALAEGYHLSDILRRVTYLTGDESLVKDYTDRVNKSVERSPALSRLSAMLILEESIQQIENVEPTGQLMNVKKEIYRFPSVAVDLLSICCGITIPRVWGMIEELHKTQRISDEDAHHLTVLISISAEIRLRTYIANGGQKDRLSPLTEMKVQLDKYDVDDTVVESVFYIPDSKMLFRYYYTAIPLKTCIVYTVAKESPVRKIFPTAIFDTSSLTKGKITRQLLQLDASRRHLEAALEEEGGDEESGIGVCWSDLGDERKAISYHKQSLKMKKAIYGETSLHPDIASSLNNIGTCWSDLGDQRKAISYYEQSLKIMKSNYGETTPHPNITSSLNNIGKCWSELGGKRKAINYFEQSLKMRKAIYGETTVHPDIASPLNNIGACWSELGDQRKAISYHEQLLKMRKAIYGKTTPHPDIASSLNNIGNCLSDLGDQRKAIIYHEQSLKMTKAIYGETTPHPDIASSLNNIGACWNDLGDQRKAINYHERSLKMRKAIYGETTPHPNIASSLNNIGTCWSDLGDQRKAISYYEQSLKIRKAIYGEISPHPHIASSLNNIGTCWSDLGDQRKAISYYEQSLKIGKAIYGETTPHPDIASSLNNIGACWNYLGDQRKAISYHEQSLKIRKAIYGETTPHPDIASSLNNIGACWNELGDQRNAISYHEQSLEMKKAIYGENRECGESQNTATSHIVVDCLLVTSSLPATVVMTTACWAVIPGLSVRDAEDFS